MMAESVACSPECADPYKHKACAGLALDEATDEIVDCACPCHEEAS